MSAVLAVMLAGVILAGCEGGVVVKSESSTSDAAAMNDLAKKYGCRADYKNGDRLVKAFSEVIDCIASQTQRRS